MRVCDCQKFTNVPKVRFYLVTAEFGKEAENNCNEERKEQDCVVYKGVALRVSQTVFEVWEKVNSRNEKEKYMEAWTEVMAFSF